jgi:hypothetical protein
MSISKYQHKPRNVPEERKAPIEEATDFCNGSEDIAQMLVLHGEL